MNLTELLSVCDQVTSESCHIWIILQCTTDLDQFSVTIFGVVFSRGHLLQMSSERRAPVRCQTKGNARGKPETGLRNP